MALRFKPFLGSGDLGFTELFGGERVRKTDARIKLNALLDEVSAHIGLARNLLAKAENLKKTQKALLRVGAMVSGHKGDIDAESASLERLISDLASARNLRGGFVIPGRTEAGALLHLARTKARICEILAWELRLPKPAVFLNRMSDYLFLEAVRADARQGVRGRRT